MNTPERIAATTLVSAVITVWIGVYISDFLFCVFGGVFLGLALSIAIIEKAMGPSHEHL